MTPWRKTRILIVLLGIAVAWPTAAQEGKTYEGTVKLVGGAARVAFCASFSNESPGLLILTTDPPPDEDSPSITLGWAHTQKGRSKKKWLAGGDAGVFAGKVAGKKIVGDLLVFDEMGNLDVWLFSFTGVEVANCSLPGRAGPRRQR